MDVNGSLQVEDDDPPTDRILTIPNVLSIARLGLLALFGVLLFVDNDRVLAASILGVAGVTDFFDGYIARRFHQVSELGKILDPTVDRIVLTMSVISIAVYGAIPIWLIVIILAREVFISVMALVLASLGARRIEVLWIGKLGTFGLMFCFPLFLGGHGPGEWARVLTDVTWFLVIPSVVASFASTVIYFPIAQKALAEGRRTRAEASGSAPRPM